MTLAVIFFAATYVLMIAFGKYRPYIALASGALFILSGMLPASQMIGALDFNVLYFGLHSGATLGGNCTPIGASANIAGIGILRKEGYDVKNSDFFKIGIPFTLVAIVPAYILIWVLFGV